MHILISNTVLCSQDLLERDPTFLTATAISNLRLQLEYGPDLDTHLDSPECLVCYASAASFNYSFSFLCCLYCSLLITPSDAQENVHWRIKLGDHRPYVHSALI